MNLIEFFSTWVSPCLSCCVDPYDPYDSYGSSKGPAKRGHIVPATLPTWSCFPNVSSFCHARTICVRHKFCAGHKKCFWKSSETFLVSARRATMSPRFATSGQHRRTQCCRHNVSLFCRGLMYSRRVVQPVGRLMYSQVVKFAHKTCVDKLSQFETTLISQRVYLLEKLWQPCLGARAIAFFRKFPTR